MARKTTLPTGKSARRAPACPAGKAGQTPKKTPKKPARPRKVAVQGSKAQGRADVQGMAAGVPQWSAAEIAEAFRRWRAALPEPKGELEHGNAYQLLVAVVMSAQATDAGVNKATRPLFAQVDTPEKMVALGEARLSEAIKTIGLYRMKAKNVIALSERLIAQHGGEVPRQRAALEALPGVGRKTANVVLNIAFGEPTLAVDTHVFRVSNRTGLAPGRNVLEVELKLDRVVPAEFKPHAHHWLILHGRYVCKALRPACDKCLINDLCHWPGKVTPAGAASA